LGLGVSYDKMKTLFLLIVLTRNGAGDINASFVNTQTQEQCQQKIQVVEAVFRAAGIAVIESRCIKNKQVFSGFEHALNSADIRYFYYIDLQEISVSILPMANWRQCMDTQKVNAGKAGGYCCSSVQAVQ